MTGKGKVCPVCGDHMISLSSMNKRICDCGYQEPFKLKPGQKSILIDNYKGGDDESCPKRDK